MKTSNWPNGVASAGMKTWPRANEPWSREEDDRLLRLFRQARKRYPKDRALGLYSMKNRIPEFVRKELGRTVWAVLARHGMLSLCRCRSRKGHAR